MRGRLELARVIRMHDGQQRWPIITILLGVGLVLSIVRFAKEERLRGLLLYFALGFVFFSGKDTVGWLTTPTTRPAVPAAATSGHMLRPAGGCAAAVLCCTPSCEAGTVPSRPSPVSR